MIGTITRHDPIGAEKAAADAESHGAPVIGITCSGSTWYVFIRVPTLRIRHRVESSVGVITISRGCNEDPESV